MSVMREMLTDIARDPSIEARSKLLSSLSDLVFDRPRPTAEEVVALCSVATLLLRVADDNSRSHFATTIAPCEHVPRDMVFLLLQDDVVVAGPVLRDSPVLTDEDLLGFIETVADDHLVFVAQRDSLGAKLVESLVSRGAEVVQLAIAENIGAKLSPTSMQVLIGNADRSQPLCQSLVRRPEVSKIDAEHLVQLITKMLKARIKSQVDSRSAVTAPALEAPKSKTVAPKLEISEILASVKAGRMSSNDAVSLLAEEDRFNDLTALLSSLTRLDDVSIMRLMVRADANGIGMILKALDISEAAFATVVALRKRRLKQSDTQSRYEREDYVKLKSSEAKATLNQLNGSRRSK